MNYDLEKIIIEITQDCNLDCLYCYNIWKNDKFNYKISNSYNKSIKLLKRLYKLFPIKHITFTGGEPLISERFLEVVLFAKMKKSSVTIITNGTNNDDNIFTELKDINVNLFEAPFHSMIPEEHDKMTNREGSHKKVLQSINSLLNLGLKVVIVIIATKINYHSIENTILYLKDLGINQIMLNRFNIGGKGIYNNEKLRLNSSDLNMLFHKVDNLLVGNKLHITSNISTPYCFLNPYNFKNIRFARCSSDLKKMPLTIDINGNIRLCNHTPYILGNIFNDKIETIFCNNHLKDWDEQYPDMCKNCIYLSECRGGCKAAVLQMNKPLNEADPILDIW
ncbi:MAG: radical SAM protein [Spirochaetes bacterium]|nr:radical SAM protein [Spirochaetota bacterium]